MADDRTFVLIGEFRDGITSHLEKINGSINQLKANLGTFAGKKGSFSDLTQSLGKVVGAHKRLSDEVKTLRDEMRASLPIIREYRKEVGKAVSANVNLSSGKYVKKNNPYLKFLSDAKRETQDLANITKKVQFGPRIPRRSRADGGSGYGGGGGVDSGLRIPRPPRPPKPPRITPGGGGGSGGYTPPTAPSRSASTFGTKKFGVSRDETFAFGQTLGYTLGSAMTGAVVQGFQIGVGFMALPFKHLTEAIQERVVDESSDVQTAGAMFAISERKNMKMFSNFNQAIRAQQEINKKLAESAAALPGATSEYVQMGKRVLDSMMTVLSKDVAGVSKFAAELGAKPGDSKDVLATLTQKFTEKAVLLGQGSQYRGAYGVPQLLEMLIGSENISENMFNRFAQFRELPIFQSVFRDLEGELSKTGAFSAERIRMVFRLLDEALPNEVVQAHKNTMAGFLEATRSAFLDPEVGLLGLGRKVQGFQVAMVDQYGNFLNKQGQIVSGWDEAYKEQISIYEAIQKILTGFGLPLSELAAILPQLYEPFAQILAPLQSLFKVAQGFYRNFNIYTREFEDLMRALESQGLKEEAKKIRKTKGARGALLAISNLLATFGDMSGGKFKEISTKLQDPAADIASVAKEVMAALFDSSFMEDLGYQIGLIVGGVINTLAQLLGFTTGALGDAKILKGLKAGFDAVDGMKAVQFIIQNIFKLLFKAIFEVFKLAPFEFAIIGAVTLILPAFVSAFSIAFANFIEKYVDFVLARTTRQLSIAKSKIPDSRALVQLYKLDNAKVRSGFAEGGKGRGVADTYARTAEDLKFIPEAKAKPTRLQAGVRSPAFRAIPDTRLVNPQFPQVALPGKLKPGIGGVTGPYKAPEVPKKPLPLPELGFRQKALEEIRAVLSRFTTGLKGFNEELASFSRSLTTVPLEKTRSLIPTLSSKIQLIGGKLKGLQSLLLSLFDGILLALSGNVLTAIKSAIDGIKSIDRKLVDFAGRISEISFEDVRVVAAGFPAKLNLFFGKLKGFQSQLVSYFDEIVFGISALPKGLPSTDKVTDVIGSFFKVFTSIGSFYVRVVEGNINLLADIQDFLAPATSRLKPVIDSFAKLLTAVNSFFARLVEGNARLLSNVQSFLAPAASRTKDVIGSFFKVFTSIGSFYVRVVEGNINLVADIQDFLAPVSSKVKDVVKSFFKVFADIGSFYVRVVEGNINLGLLIEDRLSAIKTRFQGVASSITNSFDNISQGLVNIAKGGKGFKAGIIARISNLRGQLAGLRSAVLSYIDEAIAAIASLPKALPIPKKGVPSGKPSAGLRERISGAVESAKKATKGIPVRIQSVVPGAFDKARGFLGKVGTKLGAGGLTGLKNPVEMLGKFGIALTAVTGILNGVARFFATGDIWKSLGATAGPIIGTILGYAIAGPLGSFIGGWILSETRITDRIGEVFRQVADSMAYTGETLAATGSDLLKFVQSLTGAQTEAQAFQQLLAGINIILFPLTATFDALAVGASLVRIAFLELIMFVDKTFQGGKRQKDLAKDYLEANRSFNRLIAANDEKYARISRRKGDKGILGGKEVTWSGTEWVRSDGKPAKGVKPPATPKTPKPAVASAPKPTAPAKPLAPAIKPVKEIQKTAQNTTQLNQKSAQQVTATNAAKTATDATRKATEATKNAVVAQKASLGTIQTTLSAMYALLASGMLRVQTQTQPGMITGPFGYPAPKPVTGLSENPTPLDQLLNQYLKGKTPNNSQVDPNGRFKGALGDAVASEMKNKPPGSDLVIANTSETVIPAAGGYGMLDFVETLRSGFNRMATVFQTAQQRQDGLLRQLNNTLISNQQQTNTRLAALETKFTSPSAPGGLGGAAAGGVDAFTPIAQSFGLQMTSGYRPGDAGWHGANRARDFSNGAGPTPQMLQFAQYLASTYGSSLKELIYTPLGYSIKDGQIVPPYAQNSHLNHVHVAYALGPNQGKMFTDLSAARNWEESMVPGSVKVASITGNSREGFGGETNVVNNFTITQQPGEDGEALANRVATLFYDAMNNAQSASIFS